MRRPILYAVVGGVNTVTDFVLFSILYFYLGWPLLVANSAAFAGAVTQSFVLNRRWTFRESVPSSLGTRSQYGRFVGVNITALLISNAVLLVLHGALPVVASKVIATVVTYLVGYNLTRLFVFRAETG